MSNPTGWSYAELTEAFLGRGDLIDALYEQQETMGDAIDGMDTKIECLKSERDWARDDASKTRAFLAITHDTIERVRALCEDTGGPDSWSHTFEGSPSVFVDDVLAAIEGTP